MDWSNESYIRVYTRDTRSWLKLRWEGQCLFMMLLRKVDRAGILDDIEDPEDDLSLITGFPVEHVKSGLSRLIDLGIVRINTDNTLLIPNYMEAQEATKSDKQRQRIFRERRRLKAKTVTERDFEQTERNEIVTGDNEQSQVVTSGHSLPYCADPLPSVAVPNSTDLKKKTTKKKNLAYSDRFLEFFDSYPRSVGRPSAWKAWQKAEKDERLPEQSIIIAALEKQNMAGDKYTPHPSTWLNDDRWECKPPKQTEINNVKYTASEQAYMRNQKVLEDYAVEAQEERERMVANGQIDAQGNIVT